MHLQVDLDCQLAVLPDRKVPVSVREKFKVELQRLQDLKMPEWASQLVVKPSALPMMNLSKIKVTQITIVTCRVL